MFATFTAVLEILGIVTFAVTGALVASRKQLDIISFILFGTITGVGGGTIRDVLTGVLPVFWIREPHIIALCIGVSCLMFFVAHIPKSRMRLLLWLDTLGLALFAVTGAEASLQAGVGPVVAVTMGVITATFGGMIRDVIGGETPVVLNQEVYVTAAVCGASAFVLLTHSGVPRDPALAMSFGLAFGVRAAALVWKWSLPRYRPRPIRTE